MNADLYQGLPRWLVVILVVMFILSLTLLNYGNYQSGAELWMMVVNTLLLSIPLGMLYFSTGVMIAAALQKRSQGKIHPRLAKLIYLTPRIAGILLAVFVGLFALDVFSLDGSFWELMLGFLIHALPAIVMGIALALAWRWEWIGFLVFEGAAVYFLRFVIGQPFSGLGILLLFSGPMAAIGLLFGANWRWRKELRPGI